jgi:hypothetical protein
MIQTFLTSAVAFLTSAFAAWSAVHSAKAPSVRAAVVNILITSISSLEKALTGIFHVRSQGGRRRAAATQRASMSAVAALVTG